MVYAVWSRDSWMATIHLIIGFPVGVLSFVTVISLLASTVGLAITVIFGAVFLIALLASVQAFTALQRSRFRALLGVDIPSIPRLTASSLPRRLLAEIRSPDMWRQILYHLLALIIGTVGCVLAAVTWSLGLGLSIVGLYQGVLAEHTSGKELYDTAALCVITAIGLMVLLLRALGCPGHRLYRRSHGDRASRAKPQPDTRPPGRGSDP